ncbi:hypothetical protein ACRYCC_18800 [Actinomadura scrupuli]|uniref:hypothetical protein n=1 Tax=Actinomadura scrupuli TaxID=559629 RepID=UPI003D97BD4A
MKALPTWTRLVADGTTTVLVNFVSMLMPPFRSGVVTHEFIRKELESHLSSPAVKVAKRFVSVASQDDLLPCHTVLVATDTSLRLEVYAKMAYLRTWVARAAALILLYPCGTYAVAENGPVEGARIIWVEFPK